MTSQARIDSDGLLRLPAKFLERHGLGSGGDVIVEETADGIVIRPLSEVIRQAQGWSRRTLANAPEATLSNFIAERRRSGAAE